MPNPEEHNRMVERAMKELQPTPLTADEREFQRIMMAAKDVGRRVKLELFNKSFNSRNEKAEYVGKAFLNHFHSWTKEDLLVLVCVMHSEIVLNA